MRPSHFTLLAAVVACGSDPTTSTTTDSAGTSSTSTDPTATTPDTPTSTTTEDPTGGASMTASGTTTASASTTDAPSTTTTSSSTTSDDTSSTTAPVDDTTTTSTTAPDDTTTTSTTAPPDDSTATVGDTTTEDPIEPCACPDLEVPLDDGIFVLSITAELWKFFPANNSFEKLGNLTCDLPPNTFSMAVDRLGYAWVQYSGGQLRTVDVTNVANCTNPGYQVGQQGIVNFGMAFVSNSAIDACDRIYGVRGTGVPEGNAISDFFSIDPDSLLVEQVGKSDYGTAEVTGTGDGRAFLFAGANPAKLVEINKSTGAKLDTTPLTGVELGSAWAFAHFAGDFYFFTNSKNGPGSEVTHIDYDDDDNSGQQEITVVVPDAPISIVGAGVSTCAPFAPQ